MRQTRRKGTQGVLHPRCCESPCDGQQCLIFDEENWWEVLDDLPCFTKSLTGTSPAMRAVLMSMSREQLREVAMAAIRSNTLPDMLREWFDLIVQTARYHDPHVNLKATANIAKGCLVATLL